MNSSKALSFRWQLALCLIGALILAIPAWLLWFGPLFVIGSIPFLLLGSAERPMRDRFVILVVSAVSAVIFAIALTFVGYSALQSAIEAGRLSAYRFDGTALSTANLALRGLTDGVKAIGWCVLFASAGFGLTWAQATLERERAKRAADETAV